MVCVATSKTTAQGVEAGEISVADSQIEGLRDGVDEKLVSLLRDNARMTLTALARELSLSRTAVQARMARLERDKVILGYHAALGAPRGRAEPEGLRAVLSITFSQRPCRPVVEKFRHWPEITDYYSVTGPHDAYLVVKVGDTLGLSQVVDRLSALAGVARVESAVVLKSELA